MAKLARMSPMLMIRTPVKVTILRFSTRAINGLTNTPPVQVRPLAIVPTNETRASRPRASTIVLVGDVYSS